MWSSAQDWDYERAAKPKCGGSKMRVQLPLCDELSRQCHDAGARIQQRAHVVVVFVTMHTSGSAAAAPSRWLVMSQAGPQRREPLHLHCNDYDDLQDERHSHLAKNSNLRPNRHTGTDTDASPRYSHMVTEAI